MARCPGIEAEWTTIKLLWKLFNFRSVLFAFLPGRQSSFDSSNEWNHHPVIFFCDLVISFLSFFFYFLIIIKHFVLNEFPSLKINPVVWVCSSAISSGSSSFTPSWESENANLSTGGRNGYSLSRADVFRKNHKVGGGREIKKKKKCSKKNKNRKKGTRRATPLLNVLMQNTTLYEYVCFFIFCRWWVWFFLSDGVEKWFQVIRASFSAGRVSL